MRGAHDLVEARAPARCPFWTTRGQSPEVARDAGPLRRAPRARFSDVLSKDEAKAVVRELKAVGGNLRALRVALTGAERGPELWAVLRALPRDEALRRALPS